MLNVGTGGRRQCVLCLITHSLDNRRSYQPLLRRLLLIPKILAWRQRPSRLQRVLDIWPLALDSNQNCACEICSRDKVYNRLVARQRHKFFAAVSSLHVGVIDSVLPAGTCVPRASPLREIQPGCDLCAKPLPPVIALSLWCEARDGLTASICDDGVRGERRQTVCAGNFQNGQCCSPAWRSAGS